MMTVILLTVQICGLFWKTSSFLIRLAADDAEFQRPGKGMNQNEERHEPPFHVFRGRTPAFGRNCPGTGSIGRPTARNRRPCGKSRENGRISSASSGGNRHRTARRRLLV